MDDYTIVVLLYTNHNPNINMESLNARVLQLVKSRTCPDDTIQSVCKPTSKRAKINYGELTHYIRVQDIKGIVDTFGEVKGDTLAAHKLAEFCIDRWDMTPMVYEYVKKYLMSPLRYPVIHNKPVLAESTSVYADDFGTEWEFKRYCEFVELKIKTKDGWIDKAPYVDAKLKISGANAFIYAGRYVGAKFAAPFKMNQSTDVFDRISYHFHTHNLEIARLIQNFTFDARSIKYLENHFEFCTEGNACNINRVVRTISMLNPEFVVPMTFKLKFEMITGRVAVPQSDLKTITNDPNDPSNNPDSITEARNGSRRGRKQRRRMTPHEA